MRSIVIVTIFSIFLSGCTWGNFLSIEREVPLEPGTGVMVDIKQRGVYVLKDDHGRPISCAEPSPDALSAYAASFAAEGSVPQQFSGKATGAFSENAAYVGLRTQTIQLLRDGLFRLCEGFMDGAIGEQDFSMMQRRYQANMIALLAIEQLTGTVRTSTVALNTTANAAAEDHTLELMDKRDAIKKSLDQDNVKLTELKKDETKNAAEITALKKTMKDKEDDIARLDEAINSASSLSASAVGTSQISVFAPRESYTAQSDTAKAVAASVKEITLAIVRADYSSQMCFEFFKGRRKEDPQNASDLAKYCNGVFENIVAREQASISRENECVDLAWRLSDKGKEEEASKLLQSSYCGMKVADTSPLPPQAPLSAPAPDH